MKLPGPDPDSSTSLTNSTPFSFSRRWSSRMSVNDSTAAASLLVPGVVAYGLSLAIVG